jgi:ornithine carbamoyltransferase
LSLIYTNRILKEVTLKKDLLSVSDLSSEEIKSLLLEAVHMKERGWSRVLEHKVLALVFEKPSLRTRVSFDVAMRQLGGHTIYLSPEEVGMGKREPVSDVGRVLSRYADVIAARTFSHQTLEVLAEYSSVPVINALSDFEHPCQAMADILTIYEIKGAPRYLTLTYIGDGNNVAQSLMLAASLTGMNFRIASPKGYTVNDGLLRNARDYAEANGSEIFCTEEPELAAAAANVIYTDVWTSMGQESESEKRRKVFAGYQVNNRIMSLAGNDALFMHPLPAHHGEEVSDDVLYGEQSVVFDQAENRLHAQKTVLAMLLGGLEIPLAGFR